MGGEKAYVSLARAVALLLVAGAVVILSRHGFGYVCVVCVVCVWMRNVDGEDDVEETERRKRG